MREISVYVMIIREGPVVHDGEEVVLLPKGVHWSEATVAVGEVLIGIGARDKVLARKGAGRGAGFKKYRNVDNLKK